jgi:hypothetical protein
LIGITDLKVQRELGKEQDMADEAARTDETEVEAHGFSEGNTGEGNTGEAHDDDSDDVAAHGFRMGNTGEGNTGEAFTEGNTGE